MSASDHTRAALRFLIGKGILMQRHAPDQRGAFELRRSHARSNGTGVGWMAEVVAKAHGVLP